MRRHLPPVTALAWAVFGLVAAPAVAGVSLRLVPTADPVQPAEEFDVELRVDPGSPLNAFDLVLGYDPAHLTLLVRSRQLQEGPLFVAACANRYHSLTLAPDSTKVSVSNVLLCAGASVSGPGTLYTLRFRAKYVDVVTPLTLLPATDVYLAGLFVRPLEKHHATVQIGGPTSTDADLPTPALRLSAAPNPFNPVTTMSFELASAQAVTMEIFGVDGRRVVALLGGELPPGRHSVNWTGLDQAGIPVGSGVYLARLRAGPLLSVARLVLVR